MHGTFRSQVEGGAAISVRFDPVLTPAAAPGRGRAKWAALLAGCCVVALPYATNKDASIPPVRILPSPATQTVRAASAPTADRHPVKQVAHAPSRSASPRTKQTKRATLASQIARPASYGSTFAPEQPSGTFSPSSLAITDPVNMAPPIAPLNKQPLPAHAELPQAPAPVLIAAEQLDIAAPELAAVKLPDMAAPLLAAAEVPPAPPRNTRPIDAPRPVDVAQLSESEVPSLRIRQAHEPGLAAGSEPALAAKIADMQVTPLPPARLRDSDRALLLAEAPTRMTVRVGNAALGKVDFRMTDTRTIDVRLSGLLDLLADHYDTAEFTRLRNSAAADSFVSFDQLRALGLKLRYDPVYDELRING